MKVWECNALERVIKEERMDFWDFWIALKESSNPVSTTNELIKSNLCDYDDEQIAEVIIAADIYEFIDKRKLDTKSIKKIINTIGLTKFQSDSWKKVVRRDCLRILKANLFARDYEKCRKLVIGSVGV